MFQQGEYVYYGRTGVCRVQELRETEAGELNYVLSPLCQSYSITTPVNGKAFIRPVLSREEAEALIDAIPTIPVPAPRSGNLREKDGLYKAMLLSHDSRELLALTMSLYRSREETLRARKKVSATDERYLREGEALLFGELSVALQIPLKEVPDYISRRVGENKSLSH